MFFDIIWSPPVYAVIELTTGLEMHETIKIALELFNNSTATQLKCRPYPAIGAEHIYGAFS
jgi:hypothetical protein